MVDATTGQVILWYNSSGNSLMPRATLRRVGGSVMVAVPPDYLTRTGLGADEVVTWEIDGNRLVMCPTTIRPHYTLAELLAQCDRSARRTKTDRDWTTGEAVGRELI
jgi:antitoxin ChpS